MITSAGCRYTGSLPAMIVGGKIVIQGGSGQVDPARTLRSVGAGNGMTLTAVGRLSGNKRFQNPSSGLEIDQTPGAAGRDLPVDAPLLAVPVLIDMRGAPNLIL